MGLTKDSDPTIVKWAKWGSAILAFLAILFSVGVATIKTGVQWASAPMIRAVREESLVRDSLIVSRIEALARKQDQLAIALSFPDGASRDVMLERVLGIKPRQVILPENAQAPQEKTGGEP